MGERDVSSDKPVGGIQAAERETERNAPEPCGAVGRDSLMEGPCEESRKSICINPVSLSLPRTTEGRCSVKSEQEGFCTCKRIAAN